MSSSNDQPLPSGWSRGFSRTQKKPFYLCESTNHTQWHYPTDDDAADPHGAKRRVEETMRSEMAARKGKRAKTTGGLDAEDERPTSVAIIVPYRDLHPAQNRARHLKAFIPHMLRFLDRLKRRDLVTEYHVYIIDQSDDGRKFNRGKLLNIGFDLARRDRKKGHNVFIFHDVDLLPGDDLGEWYAKFPKRPLHIARVWDRYSNNPKYFGGIVSFSAEDMRKINGYPNTFWGWGGEDDEMQKRCEKTNIKWEHPPGGTIRDLEEMNLKEKLDFLRKNKKWKCMVKWEALDEHDKTWNTNGLADLRYEVLGTSPLDSAASVEESKATKVSVDVKLNANHWGNDKCGVEYMGG